MEKELWTLLAEWHEAKAELSQLRFHKTNQLFFKRLMELEFTSARLCSGYAGEAEDPHILQPSEVPRAQDG